MAEQNEQKKQPFASFPGTPVAILFALAMAVLIAASIVFRQEKKPLPVYFDLPAFSLIDQYDEPVTLETFRDHVWVANFFFTTCRGPCPTLTANMARIARETKDWPKGEELRFVSFSVDPERDTPEVLREYIERMNVGDIERWYFVTGPIGEINRVVEQGFRMPLEPWEGPVEPAADGREPSDEPQYHIAHAERFVLVDREGRIRGYYDQEPARLELLQKHMIQLLGDRPKAVRFTEDAPPPRIGEQAPAE